jgi:hypothetical protein
MAKAAQTAKQHEALILAPFLDIATEDGSALASFMAHCGIDVATSKAARDQILDHYRLPNGKYDVDLVARDLLRWPPIAARIDERRRQPKSFR